MADQIGDPLGILHVGLATGHVADMPGVANDQLKITLQYRVDWPPIDASALYPNMGHPCRLQPVAQRFQFPRHRAERDAPLVLLG
jgi:hypothetical protein